MVEGMSVVVNVMLSLISVMSPPPALCNLSVRTVVKLCTWGVLGFLNVDDIYMCVVPKQFEPLKFVFYSVYVDLQYNESSHTFTAGSVSVVMWSSMVCLSGCRGNLCECGSCCDRDAFTVFVACVYVEIM